MGDTELLTEIRDILKHDSDRWFSTPKQLEQAQASIEEANAIIEANAVSLEKAGFSELAAKVRSVI